MSRPGEMDRANLIARRIAILFGVCVVLGIIALGVNVIWGPALKRDSLCGMLNEGEEIDLKAFSSKVRTFDRDPVILLENGTTTKQIDAPNANDPDLPKNLTGSVSVNFGSETDRVRCIVRFKDGHVLSVRMD